MLQDQVIAEIKAIPAEKLLDEVFGRLYKKEQKAVSIDSNKRYAAERINVECFKNKIIPIPDNIPLISEEGK
jgi:hypothetical protein